MNVEGFPKWGRLPEYDNLVCVLLSELSNTLPLPDFWGLEKNEQKVAIAVCRATQMTPEQWERLSLPERVPWLEETIESLSSQTDDTGWPNQTEVANNLGINKTKVARLIVAEELKDNGKHGRDRRVDPASVLAYCDKVGIAYNDT